MQHILITGVAGFIGSNLAEYLLSSIDCKIIGIDNLSSGRLDNLKSILKHPNFKFYEGDILEIGNILKNNSIKFDACVHLAAFVSVPNSFKNKDTCFKTNVEGTQSVIDFCVNKNVLKFIFASSAAVYGEPKEIPIKETIALNPLSPYAESKVENEKAAESAAKVNNITTIGLRFFNVFGPKQNLESNYGSVVPAFFNAICKNKPVTIFGDGYQTRDFIFIDNLCEAIKRLLNINMEVPSISLNISTGRELTILELAKKMAEIEGKKLEIEFHPTREGDIKNSLADNSVSTNLIGDYNIIGLNQGLIKTKQFYEFD